MNTIANTSGYATPASYVRDLLRLLGLRMRLAVETRHGAAGGEYDMSGLFLARQEVDAVLGELCGIDDPAEPEPASDLLRSIREAERALQSRLDPGAGPADRPPLPLELASAIFGLSDIDRDILIVCLAHALDGRYEKIFAYLNNDLTRPFPTPRMIATLRGYDFERRLEMRTRLAVTAPLRRYRLLTLPEIESYSLMSGRLVLEERMAEYLTGAVGVDPEAAEYLSFARPESLDSLAVNARRREEIAGVARLLRGRPAAVVSLFGPRGSGRLRSAAAICASADLPLIHCSLRRLLAVHDPGDFREAVRRAFREALLFQAGLIFTDLELIATPGEAPRDGLFAFLQKELGDIEGPFFVQAETRPELELPAHVPVFELEFGVPDYPLRNSIWTRALAQSGFEEKFKDSGGQLTAADLAARYTLTAGQIERAVRDAATHLLVGGEGLSANEALLHACQNGNSRRLAELALRIEPKFNWNDIILPREQLRQMREICAHMAFREQVYDDWGYDRKLASGRGLNILFTGPPGTGKTMAASIIARELGLILYRIDLSAVVSKYVGETEKNLSRIFREAAQSQAVLFFDEADALFGKRSEVIDAHDRYANIETGYLLQKMEEYEGVTILATNLSENMDGAFTRRLHFIVDFPMPDRTDRERIWRLSFPEKAPLAGDADFAFLAERLKLSGANIKSIALHAAFYAASDQSAIDMRHIARAARREYEKEGRPLPRTDMAAFLKMAAQPEETSWEVAAS
jgi:AAA+ superfamily predicted ATPase